MCISYHTISRQLSFEFFRTPLEEGEQWRDEVYQDYRAPFIIGDGPGRRRALIGGYGLVPRRHLPPGVKSLSTMNARAETLGEKKTYRGPWTRGQLCLVPMTCFYEPNYESGAHQRWAIAMADGRPFAVAGLYREWVEGDGGLAHAFTQITINAGAHPLMNRFHAPGDEKRSLVIVPERDYDAWLSCAGPEEARAFLRLYPAALMRAAPAPKPVRARPAAHEDASEPAPTPEHAMRQRSLF